jgi:magnesium transporter
MQRSRIYIDGKLAEGTVTLENIAQFAQQPGTTVWLDLVDPTDDELRALGAHLGLHQLAVEDAFKGRQRAKLEHYDSHLFINAYAADWDPEKDELTTYELSAFVTPHALITVRDDDGWDVGLLSKRWDDSASLGTMGVAFLLWGLLDVIVDGYFELVEKLDVEVDELEDLLFVEDNKHTIEIQRRTFSLRKALVTLRRVAIPMREIVNPLVRHDTQVIGGEMMPYFQDIYDHVMRVADWTDSLRDLVTTVLETNLTMQGNRMNLVMKKVTSWAAIIAVPTAITGWFGQNVPYTGFGQQYGVYLSAGSIVVVSAVLYWAFRRNDWL